LQKQEEIYDWFVDSHLKVGKKAHNVAAFLPWHRAFTVKYERALQKIDPKVVLPYWDWSIDAQAPELSVILSEKYMGSNGEPNTHCVKDGLAKDWEIRIPERRCLKRDYRYGNRTGPFWDKSLIEAMITKNTNYHEFRQDLEYNPHAIVHDNLSHIWGDMNKMVTPNDPLFFMHHVMVDKIWWEWQQRDPKRLTEYSGYGATINDSLWRMDVNVGQVMDTTSDGSCFTYERYSSPNVLEALKQSPLLKRDKINYKDDNIWEAIDSIPFNSIPEKYKATLGTEHAKNNKLVIPDRISSELIRVNNLNPDGVQKKYEQLAKISALLNANTDFEPDTSL
ncbi:Di-copper centre-containing protein, partial [Conidiobolus coronatus NRRL 28638]